jgi:hypothetical protein
LTAAHPRWHAGVCPENQPKARSQVPVRKQPVGAQTKDSSSTQPMEMASFGKLVPFEATDGSIVLEDAGDANMSRL